MTRNTFAKFMSISTSNLKRLVLINCILLIPAALVLFTLYHLVPALVHYVDSLDVSVTDVAPRYRRLAVVILWGRGDAVYVFEKDDLRGIRRHLFLSGSREESARVLEERAIATGSVVSYRGAPFALYGKSGERVLTLQVRNVREGSMEFIFYNGWKPAPRPALALYAVILAASILFLSGCLGGVAEYTQRVVFHEMKGLSFLLTSIRRNFLRSVVVAVAVTAVLGAVAANIYFYIFMLSTDVSVFIAAVNFWMLVFFFIALLWTYPLMILNREESLWSVVKKSLYISFDNLEYSLLTLIALFAMAVGSLCTLTLFPGFAGGFSFLNNALKDLSARYNKPDTV
jgi:uncharacterized membrane protein YesL